MEAPLAQAAAEPSSGKGKPPSLIPPGESRLTRLKGEPMPFVNGRWVPVVRKKQKPSF
jgi:hypothetical protein